MLVEIARLRLAPCEYDVHLEPDYMNKTLEPTLRFESAEGRVKFSLVGNDVLARGRLCSVLHATCARCLEDGRIPLEAEVSILFRRRRHGEGQTTDHSGVDLDEPDFAWFSADEFEPDEELRELLLLEIPSITICDESCQGLCPHCGANLNRQICKCSQQPAPEELPPNTWQAEIRKLCQSNDDATNR